MFSVTKLLTKLMIHNFALAGSVLSKNHGLATFVHERLEWPLVDQTPEKSGTEWSCVDVVWYIRSLTSTNLHRRDSHQRPSRHSQSVCWRLQPPACQLGLQHSISWRWEPGLLGDSQQPCVAARPKGSSPFLLSSMERRHQRGPSLRKCRPWQPTAWQTCSRKFLAVTTPTLPHNATEVPTTIRWNAGSLARMTGRVFAFLHENPLRACHLRTQEISKRQESIPRTLWEPVSFGWTL